MLQLLQEGVFEDHDGNQYMGGDRHAAKAFDPSAPVQVYPWDINTLPSTMRFCSFVFQRTCSAKLVKEVSVFQ